jgi:hypothetical protein
LVLRSFLSFSAAAGAALGSSARQDRRKPVPHKLILNKGGEEQIQEYEDIEEAFNAAMPWIMKGYIARITDKKGVVKYTQSLSNGQIATYAGDATERRPEPEAQAGVGLSPTPPQKQWWRFW